MSKLYPLWESFAAGELSPRLFNRSTAPVYAQGLALCENAFTTTHGPVLRRPGTLYMGQYTGLREVKMFEYWVSKSLVFLLVFVSDGNLYVWNVSPGTVPTQVQAIAGPYTTNEKVRQLQAVMLPKKETTKYTMVLLNGTEEFRQVRYDAGPGTWEFSIWGQEQPPSEWTGTNWPSVLTLYQGRLWVGATPNAPEGLWASKSGDYNDFAKGSNDDDALEFELAANGRIEYLVGTKTLICGTVNGEHIISRRESTVGSGPITAANVNALQQSAYGSLDVQPVRIGQYVVYGSADGKKVRDIGYKWEEDGWLSRDVTFMSEHICKRHPLRELAFEQNPENLLWAVSEDGTFQCCTYDVNADMVGWHRHTTAGQVRAVATVNAGGDNQTYLAVHRSGNLYIEKMVPEWEQISGINHNIYVDSAHVQTGSGISQITGATHLANQTVDVTIDGAVHPQVQIDGSGNATLQYPGDQIIAGLNYRPKITTLPLDRDMPNEAGTTRGFMKRSNKVWVRVISSARPIINGKRPPDRTPSTPMDTPEPFSDDEFMVVNLGWDRPAQITIEEDQPVAFNIGGIWAETAAKVVS